MSKIQTIMPNHFGDQKIGNVNREVIPPMTRKSKNLSFGNGQTELTEFVRKTYGPKHIENKIGYKGWISWLSQKLQKNKGEIQSQLMNAIFTCTLAPAMIAFNPLSKTDEKTKKYSAWRQPISALNAVTVGLAMTKPVDMFMEWVGSKGYIEGADIRVRPDDKYLGRKFNKEYRNVKNDKAKLEEFLNSFSSEKERLDARNDVKDLFPNASERKINNNTLGKIKDLYVKNEQKKAKEFFTELLYKDINNLQNDDIIKKKSIIHNVSNLDEYLKKNNLQEIGFKDLAKDNLKIKFFEEKIKENGKTRINIELKENAFIEQLKKMDAVDFVRNLGLVKYERDDNEGAIKKGSFTEEDLREFLVKKPEDPSIKKEPIKAYQLLTEIGVNPEKEFVEDVKNEKASTVLTKLANKLKGLKDLVGEEVKDGGGIKTELKHIASQLMVNNIYAAKAKFGGIKQYGALFFNLFGAAISCAALNWMYPRIVEKIAPDLVKDDAKKGGNK